MNAWRDHLPRIVGELLRAVLLGDWQTCSRSFWRIAGRIGLHKPVGPYAEIHRAAWEFAGACAVCAVVGLFWFLVLVLPALGGTAA
jgi:hypothetical protein